MALVGLNSSRFLSLDVAIGLSGAVSVPLYYTAPVTEIEGILKASGARLLLVGAPAVLARVAELRSAVTIASMETAAGPAAADFTIRRMAPKNRVDIGAMVSVGLGLK